MSSIWDDDDDDDDHEVTSNETQQAVVPKGSTVEVDLVNREAVSTEIKKLFDSLTVCDNIVVTAFKITESVPTLTNDKIKKFWNDKMIPTLVCIVQQDAKARSVIWQSFSSVHNLAISINEGAGMVMKLKGSSVAIQAAQTTISGALDNLTKNISAAKELNTAALKNFKENIDMLFHVMGPNAADFVNQKVEIHRQLDEKYQKKRELMDELSKQREILEIHSNMIHVIESKISGAKNALEATKQRSKELHSLNKRIDEKIADISSTYSVRRSVTSSNSSYKSLYTIANPNREIQKQFYEAQIKERIARIKDINDEESQKQAIHDDLTKSLSEYKGKYDSAHAMMKEHEKTFQEKMKMLQHEIDNLQKQLINTSIMDSGVIQEIGLQGQNLIDFLQLVTILQADIHRGVNAYEPLEAALTATKAMVEVHVMLLKSGSDSDVYTAGASLLQKVVWLQQYHTDASKQLKTSEEYQAISNRHAPRAITSS